MHALIGRLLIFQFSLFLRNNLNLHFTFRKILRHFYFTLSARIVKRVVQIHFVHTFNLGFVQIQIRIFDILDK